MTQFGWVVPWYAYQEYNLYIKPQFWEFFESDTTKLNINDRLWGQLEIDFLTFRRLSK